jgi:hypothetical protein
MTPAEALEPWRDVWRNGVAPLLSVPALAALRDALAADDPRLMQGRTVFPPGCITTLPPERCCAIGLALWLGDGLKTPFAVSDRFASIMLEGDILIESRFRTTADFTNWFDLTARDEVRAALLPEVERSLNARPPQAA